MNLHVPLKISETSISSKKVKPNETITFFGDDGPSQIESSRWENNMKRVAVAAFIGNSSRKISVNRNMAAHSRCLLMSGAVHRRYYCIYFQNYMFIVYH